MPPKPISGTHVHLSFSSQKFDSSAKLCLFVCCSRVAAADCLFERVRALTCREKNTAAALRDIWGSSKYEERSQTPSSATCTGCSLLFVQLRNIWAGWQRVSVGEPTLLGILKQIEAREKVRRTHPILALRR